MGGGKPPPKKERFMNRKIYYYVPLNELFIIEKIKGKHETFFHIQNENNFYPGDNLLIEREIYLNKLIYIGDL